MVIEIVKLGLARSDQDFIYPGIHLLAFGTHLVQDHCIFILLP